MKLSISLFLAAATAANAFAPTPVGTRNSMRLHTTRPDTTQYVAAALQASKTYGATSKEAQIAWETVEEMSSSDNSSAYSGGANFEYGEKMAELSRLIETDAPKLDKIKNLASEITAIKLANPQRIAGADSPLLRKALETAKQATEEFGVESSQAKLAWEDVEEIASASNDNAMGTNLIDECLVEQIEACEGLEELTRVLNLGTEDGSRYSG